MHVVTVSESSYIHQLCCIFKMFSSWTILRTLHALFFNSFPVLEGKSVMKTSYVGMSVPRSLSSHCLLCVSAFITISCRRCFSNESWVSTDLCAKQFVFRDLLLLCSFNRKIVESFLSTHDLSSLWFWTSLTTPEKIQVKKKKSQHREKKLAKKFYLNQNKKLFAIGTC